VRNHIVINSGKFVFAQILSIINSYKFSKCVKRYNCNFNTRGLNCWNQFVQLFFGQFTARNGLIDIYLSLSAHKNNLYYLGIKQSVNQSTLSCANESRNWRIFANFGEYLIILVQPHMLIVRYRIWRWITIFLLSIQQLSHVVSHFGVGQGVSVSFELSRFIIAWDLRSQMTSKDIMPSVDNAFKFAGLKKKNAPNLLSDNGSCYISEEMKGFIRGKGIKPINRKPLLPQTPRKIERYHRTMKNVIKLDNYYSPEDLIKAIAEFVN
jgi:hypothetical protein